MQSSVLKQTGIKPPPTASSKPKPPVAKKQPYGYSNPFEMVKEQGKEALKEVGSVPGEILQQAADDMWSALLGSEARPVHRTEGEKPPDTFTRLNTQKLNDAYAKQDMDAVAAIQNSLQEHSEEKAENQVRHRQVKQDEERAIAEIETEEEQKKKKELEEEQQKKQEEEEEKQAQQQINTSDGAAKAKGQLGKARPKATTEQVFEQGRKKG